MVFRHMRWWLLHLSFFLDNKENMNINKTTNVKMSYRFKMINQSYWGSQTCHSWMHWLTRLCLVLSMPFMVKAAVWIWETEWQTVRLAECNFPRNVHPITHTTHIQREWETLAKSYSSLFLLRTQTTALTHYTFSCMCSDSSGSSTN